MPTLSDPPLPEYAYLNAKYLQPSAGKRCGVPQCFAAIVIVAAVGGALGISVVQNGYDTSGYNWVDSFRVGVPRGMGLLLCLLYGQATLFNHHGFVDHDLFAKPCRHPANTETPEECWARTPTAARGAAVSAGGWAVCFALTLFCMTIFEPGCQRGLCITVMLTLGIWWQVVWYGAMLGRVDVNDTHKLPAKNWFINESVQEIVITCICGYLVFLAKGESFLPAPDLTVVHFIRVWFLRFIGALLTLLYGSATLFKHTMFVNDFAKPLLTETQTPEEVWCATPTASKHIAVQSGGWCVCFASTIFAMTFLVPGCERGLCKCVALVMLWWNCVWYSGMFGRVDFNDDVKRPWTNWFKSETIQEIVLFSISAYLGFTA